MKPDRHNNNILIKANRVLNLVLIALLVIAIRLWHLAVVQYEKKLEDSRKPQRRTVIEPAKRGTIRDRFNIPLAMNKINYQAAILYSQLRDIPSVVWEKNSEGKKVKVHKRKEYISKLSDMLGEELNLDRDRVEDLIHSKAALYYNLPLVIKEDLSESEYYRLKFKEKDWLGIQAQIIPRRHYPLGKTACDVIGYMGSINRSEYETILQEIQSLQAYLQQCEENPFPEVPEGIESENHARKKLQELKARAYNINDIVGKWGIEGRFEQMLRGFHGKTTYYSDARGNFLKELPGTRTPLSGQRLLLSLSAELQEYCEQLLAQNEKIRTARTSKPEPGKLALLAQRQPWIKGGAIVAIDPKTGEVIAMASYPRFDPNDYIISNRRTNISRWFETESYIGDIWNQKRGLERERYDDEKEEFYEESKNMTWEFYLERILPKTHPVATKLSTMGNIANAISLQTTFDELISLFQNAQAYWILNYLYSDHVAYGSKISPSEKRNLEESFSKNSKKISELKKQCDPFFHDIENNYNKVLLVDLCRLAVDSREFNPQLLKEVGGRSLSFHHDASGAKASVEDEVKGIARALFNEYDFKQWRKDNEKQFLKEKRAAEKAAKTYSKPFLDYLDALEGKMFDAFWNKYQYQLIISYLYGITPEENVLGPYAAHLKAWHREFSSGAHQNSPVKKAYTTLQNALSGLDPVISKAYFNTLRRFEKLDRPLLGKYRYIRKADGKHQEKHLAAAFYPTQSYGYGRSQAYRQSAAQGSIFKLVTSYAVMKQIYEDSTLAEPTIDDLNPFVMVDHTHVSNGQVCIGYHENGKEIPRLYKQGKLPRSIRPYGKLDLLKAIETSSNPYFSLIAGDVLHSPNDLLEAAKQFSYGKRTGIDLPAEIPGNLPDDLMTNRSGLYAMAIGQHSLVVTPLQTSVMLSSIVNGGHILKPQIVKMTVGSPLDKQSGSSFQYLPNFRYKKELATLGITFPLFTMNEDIKNEYKPKLIGPTIKSSIFMPDTIRSILLEGMQRVVYRTQNESLRSLSKFYKEYPEAISDYIELREELVGKTSTAESMENIDLDIENGTNLYTHVWFGGISFHKDEQSTFKDPELVVVVYLRFGVYGKEAAPIAAQVVNKWREIKRKHKESGDGA